MAYVIFRKIYIIIFFCVLFLFTLTIGVCGNFLKPIKLKMKFYKFWNRKANKNELILCLNKLRGKLIKKICYFMSYYKIMVKVI